MWNYWYCSKSHLWFWQKTNPLLTPQSSTPKPCVHVPWRAVNFTNMLCIESVAVSDATTTINSKVGPLILCTQLWRGMYAARQCPMGTHQSAHRCFHATRSSAARMNRVLAGRQACTQAGRLSQWEHVRLGLGHCVWWGSACMHVLIVLSQ